MIPGSPRCVDCKFRSVWNVLWDSSLIGLALVSEDGTFIQANPAFCRLVEYSEAELVERTWQSITHPDDLDPDDRSARLVVAGEIGTYDIRKRYLTKTGGTVWVVLRVAQVRDDASGEFQYFVSQASEILNITPPNPQMFVRRPKRPSKIVPFIKDNWTWMAAVLAAIAYVAAEVIKALK